MKGEGDRYVRSVGADLISSFVADTPAIRFEYLRYRKSSAEVHWHYRQPELSIFLFSDRSRLKATVDGRPVELPAKGDARFGIIPAATEIKGAWDIQGDEFDCMVMFFKPVFVQEWVNDEFSHCKLMFSHDGLLRIFSGLRDETAAPDAMFNLVAEGWAMQALAHISRISGIKATKSSLVEYGGRAKVVDQIDRYIRQNLAQPISIAELASVTGLSARQFLRWFHSKVGKTPYQYVMQCRIDEAKSRLLNTTESMTDIAIATGFGQAQHFSNSFKKMTKLTPSEFRGQRQL